MVLGGYYSIFLYYLTVLYLYYSSTVHSIACYYIDIIVPKYYIDIIVLKYRIPVFRLDHLYLNR